MSGYDRWRDPAEPSWMVEPTTEWHPQFPGQRYPGDIGIQQVPHRSDRNRVTATGRAEVVPLVPLDQDGRYRRGPARDDHGGPYGQGWHGRRDEHRPPVDDPYARPPVGWPPPQDRHPVEPPANAGWRTGPPADPPRADLRHQPPGWTVDRDRPREPDRPGGWHGDRPHHGPDGWGASPHDLRPYPPVSPAPRQEPGWLPEPGEHPPHGGRRHDAPEERPYGGRWHDPPERRGYPVPHHTTPGHDASGRPVPRYDAPERTGPGHDRPDGGTDSRRDSWTAHRAPERETFRPPAAPPEPPADVTSPWPDRPVSGPDRRWSGEHRSGDDRHARPQWSRDDTRAYPRQPVGRDDVPAHPPWSDGRSEPPPRDWDRSPTDSETTQAWSYPGRPGIPETARPQPQPQDDLGRIRPGNAPEDAGSRAWDVPGDAGTRRWETRPEEPTPTRARQEWSSEVEDTAPIGPAPSAARDEQRAADEQRLTAEDLRPVTGPPVEPPTAAPTVAPTPYRATDGIEPAPVVDDDAVPAGGGPAFPPVTAPPLGGLRLEFLPSPGAVRDPGQTTGDGHPAPDTARPTPAADTDRAEVVPGHDRVAPETDRAEAVPGHDRVAPETEDVAPGTPTDQPTDKVDSRVDATTTGHAGPATAAHPDPDTPATADDRPGTLVPTTDTDEPAPGTTTVEPLPDGVHARPEPEPADPDRPDSVGADGLPVPDGDADETARDVSSTGPDHGDHDGNGDGGREIATGGLDHENVPTAPAPTSEADAVATAPETVGTPETVDTVEADAVATTPEPVGAAEPLTGVTDGVAPVPSATPVSAPPSPVTPVSAPPAVDALVSAHSVPTVQAPARPAVDAPPSPPSANDPPVPALPAGAPATPAAPLPAFPLDGAEVPPTDSAAAPPLSGAPVATAVVSAPPAPPAASEPLTGATVVTPPPPDAPEFGASTPVSAPPATVTAVPVLSSPTPGPEDRAAGQTVGDRQAGPGMPAGRSAPASAPSSTVAPSSGPVSTPVAAAPPDTSPRDSADPQGADAWFRPKQPVSPTPPAPPEPERRHTVAGAPPGPAPAPVRPPVTPPASPVSAPPAFRPVVAPGGSPVPAPPVPPNPVPANPPPTDSPSADAVPTDSVPANPVPPARPVSAPPAFRPVSAPPARPASAPPGRPVSPAPGRPVSGPPGQPVSGAPHRPVSGPPGQPVSGPPHRPLSAPFGQSPFPPPVGRARDGDGPASGWAGPSHPPRSDPEQWLAGRRWRLHPETLREVVDAPDTLREARHGLTEKLGNATDNRSRARLLSLRAVTNRLLGDLDDALDDGRLALTYAEATGELRRTALVRARLARVLQWRGEFAEADRLLTEANSPELPDRLRATLHEHLARSGYEQGRHVEACQHFERALDLRRGEDRELIARTEVALDAILARAATEGFGPLPRAREEILLTRRPPVPSLDEERQLWGYADVEGELVVAAGYAEVQPFREGVAWVRRPDVDGWELIDDTGATLIDPSYLAVRSFSDGLAWVSRDGSGGWQAVDTADRVVVPSHFDDVRPFRSGVAAVRVDGAWGAVDRSGRMVVPPRYDGFTTPLADGRYVDGFTDEGLAVVDLGGRRGVLDRSGRAVVTPEHAAVVVHPVAFLVRDPAGRWGALDRRGEPLIEPVHGSRDRLMAEIDHLLADTEPLL
ncbi:WG repeat-containing protein [Micromonospora sp. NPDC050187]|uniref:WG repeat-containing protein n=1 Tax=Micromonospora sp. NPDC050187 TaxID=3364277 RepID=UPI003787AA42